MSNLPQLVLRYLSLPILITIFAVSPAAAQTPAFEHGALSWTRDLSFTQPNMAKVRVTFDGSYQRSGLSPLPQVGSVLNNLVMFYVSGTGYSDTQSLAFTVQSVNATSDYFSGNAGIDLVVPMSAFPLSVLYSGCCRPSTLLDGNGSTPFQLRTVIDLSQASRSPTTSITPRIIATANQLLAFQIPSASYEGFTNTFALMQVSGLVTTSPSAPAAGSPDTFKVTANGFVSWRPSTTGLYAVQFSITSRDSLQAAKATAPVDVIIEVVPQCSTCAVVTVNAPLVANTFVGHDAKVVISATTSGLNSTPSLVYTPLATNMHIRQLTSGQTSTWQVSWTPRPGHDGDDKVVCFQAMDPIYNVSSAGQSCTQWQVTPAQVIGLTGTVRTFAGTHPDMNRPLNENASPSANFIAPILGADSKPVFTAGAATGITRFNEWFNDVANVNQSSTYSTYLSSGGQIDPSLFSFQSANWQPVDTERYFTYEAHTALTYSPGQQLTFKSADDMWIFINHMLVPGANLHGVHTERTMTILLDMLGLTEGAAYPVDIFYAHRGAATIPSIQLQLYPEPAIPSNGPTVTTIAPGGFTPASVSTMGAAQTNATALQLLPADGGKNDAAAAWLTSGFNLRNGFDLDFSYVGSPASGGEGFAAVIAAAPGLGDAGGGLGYSGLPRSVAVEFDAKSSSASDPLYQHIAVHTLGLDPNSSQSVATVGLQPSDPNLPNAFFNATPQRVRVSYTPIVSQPFGWFRVWMNENILPQLETMLSQADFGQLLDEGRAVLGFTSGRGANTSSVTITAVRMTTTVNMPPYPADPLDFRFIEGVDTTGGAVVVLDPENDHVQAWISGSLPPGVTATYGAQGMPITFSGAPLPGTRGSYPVVLNMTDGANTVATPFTIIVNHPPVAVDDAITLASPTPIDFDPRINDFDADGDLLRILSVSIPQSGVVEIRPDGTLRYTSTAAGTDTFTYTLGDWWETTTATVTITTTPAPRRLRVSTIGDGSGRIVSTPVGIDCGALCEAEFPSSGAVSLSATADPGSVFRTWSQGCGQAAGSICVKQRNDDAPLVAFFQKLKAPELLSPFADIRVAFDSSPIVVSTVGRFRDPDGQSLQMSALSNAAWLSALLDPGTNTITLTPVGSSYGVATITVTATDPDGLQIADVFTVTIDPPVTNTPEEIPGVMHGSGVVESGGRIYDFDVRVAERKLGRERGWIDIDIKTPKTAKKKEVVDRFESTDVTDIRFWDDPAFRPSRQKKPRPIADSVFFTGVGKWNGAKGYRFEVKLTDQGEPGRGRDRLTLTIYNAAGATVATVDDVLDSGNIQSERLLARFWR